MHQNYEYDVEKKYNFFEILYKVIVNYRAIILAEFFDLLGDIVNFFDIYSNKDMTIFHPWSIIIMCLSSLSFIMNTLLKKQIASINYLKRNIINNDDIELGLIEKTKMNDKLYVLTKKRKSVYENIAESMSIILTLIIEDFMSFIFTIIVLRYNGKVELNAQLYNLIITGSMILYQLFSLWIKRNNILEERRNNLQENMIIEFSSKLKQRTGDRIDNEYMKFVDKIKDELYLCDNSKNSIKFIEKDCDFKQSIFGNNKYLKYLISCFEHFFKLHPEIKVIDIYKNSDCIDENESLLTIALDFEHYQIAIKMFEKFGIKDLNGNIQCNVTKNWLALQNNKDGAYNPKCILNKLAINNRKLSSAGENFITNYQWWQNDLWDNEGECKDKKIIKLFDNQDKQISLEMNTPLCKYLINSGVMRLNLKTAREVRKVLNALVYKDWNEVKKLWFDRNLSPYQDNYGPYLKYKREYKCMFNKDDNEKNDENLNKNIEMFKKEFPHININNIKIPQRWGIQKWWFNISILHDNILEKNFDNVIELTEKEGADPWIKTGAGENCLKLAKTIKCEKLINFFKTKYPEMDD